MTGRSDVSASAAALGGTLLLYLLGAVLLAASLLVGRSALLSGGRTVAALAALVHAAAIGLRCAELHRAPFATPGEALSLLAWMLGLIYLASERLWRLAAAGPFALGLAFLLVLLAGRLGGASAPAGGLLSENAVSVHITATLAAFGAFALAFCCAALYLIERRILKSKHGLAWMKRLPPLVTVERAAFALVAFGFPLLTLGILAGLVRAVGGGMPSGWQTDPKTLLAYGVWAVYGLYLLGRLVAGWAPARTSVVLLLGLALCLLAFLAPTAAHRFAG